MNPKNILPYDDRYLSVCRELEYRSLIKHTQVEPAEARTFIKVAEKMSNGISCIYPIDSAIHRLARSGIHLMVADDAVKDSANFDLINSIEEFLKSVDYSNVDTNGEQLPCPSFSKAKNILLERVYRYMEKEFPRPVLEDIDKGSLGPRYE